MLDQFWKRQSESVQCALLHFRVRQWVSTSLFSPWPCLCRSLPPTPTQRVDVLNYTGDGSGSSAGNRDFAFGQAGDVPVVGDWNGDGKAKAGIFRSGLWALNYNGDEDGFSASNHYYSFGPPADGPVAGDWNGDQRSKV